MTVPGLLDSFQLAALILFITVLMGRILYFLLIKKINPVAVIAGKKGVQQILEISFLLLIIIWMAEVLLSSLHAKLHILPETFAGDLAYMKLIDVRQVKLLGVALVSAGFLIFFWALASFGASWRIGIDEKTPGTLVTSGAFSFSRNPIFVFLDAYFIGTFLINGTLIFLLFALVVIGGLHYQILQEEKFLTKTYGEAYLEYRQRTGRYFGCSRQRPDGR